MRKKLIGVIGDSRVDPESENYKLAFNLGKALIDNGHRLISGGMSGIMEAASKGARASGKYSSGDIIGIIPGFDPDEGNGFVDISIATGLDTYRNVIVANSDVVVAIGGGAGTLTEMATAWILKRMVIAYKVVGWSGKLADTKIDNKLRVNFSDDKVFGVNNEKEVMELLEKYLDKYPRSHKKLNERLEF